MATPYMTFTSASGSNPIITAQDAKGQQIATLAVQSNGRRGKDFQLQREQPPNAPNIVATVTHHSLSGKFDMTIHGQSVSMSQSWEGMRSGKDISTPSGKFKWRTGGSTFHAVEELVNERTGIKVATCRIPSLRKGDMKLEISTQQEDFVVDLAVASWLVLLKD